MIARRRYMRFFAQRFLALLFIWGIFCSLLFFVHGRLEIDLLYFSVGLVLLLFVGLFFFEYDALPRGLMVRSGFRLDIEDASGKITEGIEFGIRRFLWLTRITYCAEGKVITLPLEAFHLSRREIQAGR